MPKIKTSRGAAKRFRVTATGKIRRAKAYRRHILSTKNRKRKRRLRKPALVDTTNAKAIRRLLPYL
ncbi:MAG: 50S ribosomal protein L35 [Candidatus Binatia bacterium]|nr:MAG: 50S ribosomal protein L35 [Candidatus Binatia bacterium]